MNVIDCGLTVLFSVNRYASFTKTKRKTQNAMTINKTDNRIFIIEWHVNNFLYAILLASMHASIVYIAILALFVLQNRNKRERKNTIWMIRIRRIRENLRYEFIKTINAMTPIALVAPGVRRLKSSGFRVINDQWPHPCNPAFRIYIPHLIGMHLCLYLHVCVRVYMLYNNAIRCLIHWRATPGICIPVGMRKPLHGLPLLRLPPNHEIDKESNQTIMYHYYYYDYYDYLKSISRVVSKACDTNRTRTG